jgi:uncharacterized protein YceK
MKRVESLLAAVLICICSGCASIASYTLTENGCLKRCEKADHTDYFLGSRLSYQMITSPQADPSYAKEFALKSLLVLDYPLTVVTDTVLAPFILVRNVVR